MRCARGPAWPIVIPEFGRTRDLPCVLCGTETSFRFTPAAEERGAGIERFEGRIVGALPALEAHVTLSINRPGELSFRLHADDDTWGPFFAALNAAGFRAGDVVRLTVVRR